MKNNVVVLVFLLGFINAMTMTGILNINSIINQPLKENTDSNSPHRILSSSALTMDADASFIGENEEDYAGYSVASAGDVNNDGYDDILIGAYKNDEGGDWAGKIYLIFGNEAGFFSMNTDLSNVNASFIGEAAWDRAGYSVASAGDVNNDGYNDILIGAYGIEDRPGKAYLIFGNETGSFSMDMKLSNADASFIGESIDDRAGYSVTSAGDVNNDEYDDFLIGACQNNEGGNEAGQIYLIFGRRAGSFSMNTDLSDADASFIGENEEDYAGYSVASAGDVNNDGYDDIFIGAYSRSGGFAGKAYLIFGNEVGSFSMHTNLSDADASFIGEGTGDVAGNSVASAGDVNNDGYDDILIGAYKNDEGGDWAGKIYLFFGNEADFFSMNTDLSDANASFIGEETCDFAGISVASAGDVNNDEYDDILIGACGYEKGPGKVYFIFGNEAGSFSMDTDLSNANASFIGERTYDYAGISVACAGDVNNDGYDDILIGAYGNNEGGADAGQTYLVFGGFKEEKEEDKIPGYTTLLLVIFSFSTMIFLLLKSLKKVKN